MTTLATIGFAGRSLEEFVEALRGASVSKLIDIRLRPDSQLSAYARGKDLAFLLPTYEQIEYVRLPELAPTREILDTYRKSGDWPAYVEAFTALMAERSMVDVLCQAADDHKVVALLCSEATSEQCHRRLLAESYAERHPRASVCHL